MTKLARATDPAQKFQLTTDGLKPIRWPLATSSGMKASVWTTRSLIKIYTYKVAEDANPQPAGGCGSDPHADLRLPRREANLHVPRRTTELTMRMCMRRLACLTNAQQKVGELTGCTGTSLAYYNFCRKHMRLERCDSWDVGADRSSVDAV
jgi:hypothetical protein